MGRMRDAMRWLVAKQAADDGRTVTYERAGAVCFVTAIVGRVPVVVRDRGSVGFVSRNRDYILTAPAELDFGAGPTTPAKDDRIIDSDPDDGGTFDVKPLEGEPSWRWTDGHGTALRVHTIKVA